MKHIKGWKRNYKFERQGEVLIEKERRIAWLNSREFQNRMFEIQQWNKEMHGDSNDNKGSE